jgi:hypothetical protein
MVQSLPQKAGPLRHFSICNTVFVRRMGGKGKGKGKEREEIREGKKKLYSIV